MKLIHISKVNYRKKLIKSKYILCTILIFFLSCTGILKKNPNKLKNNEIKIEYNKHLYLKGKINDTIEGNFVFDTGGYGLYLDSTFNSNIKIENPKIFNQKIKGIGLSTQTVRILSNPLYLKFGSVKYIENLTPIIPLKRIGGKKIDGIIGYSVFKDNVLRINYQNQSIQIIDTVNFKPPSNYSKIPFRIESRSIYLKLDIQVSDSINITGDFILDTGCASAIILTNEVTKQNNLKNIIRKKAEYYSNVFGVGGWSSGYYFTSKSINFAQFNIKNQIIGSSFDNEGELSQQNFLGIIGNELLEKFEIIIDFPHKLLYIKPNSNFNNKFNGKLSSLGFSYIDRTDIKGGWVVTLIYKDSNVEKAGLKLGDVITHFNDADVSKMDAKKFKQKLTKEKNQIKLTINRKGLTKEIRFKPKKLEL